MDPLDLFQTGITAGLALLALAAGIAVVLLPAWLVAQATAWLLRHAQIKVGTWRARRRAGRAAAARQARIADGTASAFDRLVEHHTRVSRALYGTDSTGNRLS